MYSRVIIPSERSVLVSLFWSQEIVRLIVGAIYVQNQI